MEATVLKLTVASLLHDIGKFALREFLELSDEYVERHASLYQPVYQGRYSHQHVISTAAFFDKFAEYFPRELCQRDWGGPESIVSLAAMHHRPSTPLEWVITEADRLASGMEREEYDEYTRSVPWKDYRQTRLLPLFEGLIRELDAPVEHEWRYGLSQVGPDSIFPRLREELDIDNETSTAEYRELYEDFVRAFKELPHRESSVGLWMEHLSSLLMVYTSFIPSARAGRQVPDISLYDHSRVVAALSVALYRYHEDEGCFTSESIAGARDLPRFRLVTGNFYGIQKFIFSPGRTSKSRAKLLRGRSAAVSIMAELAADLICHEVGLPPQCTLLNAAGRFTVLVPNTQGALTKLRKIKEQIADWLIEGSFGETAFGISSLPFSSQDLVEKKLPEIWERCVLLNEEEKYRRVDLEKFAGARGDYLDSFDNTLREPLCPFCGKRPSSRDCEDDRLLGDEHSSCRWCLDHIRIGSQLLMHDRLLILDSEKSKGLLNAPVFGRYQLKFESGSDRFDREAESGALLHYWRIQADRTGDLATDGTIRLIGGYAPRFSEQDLPPELESAERNVGKLKTFEDLARAAVSQGADGGSRGIEALGIMKADVDHLGELMNCGLREERLTRVSHLWAVFPG